VKDAIGCVAKYVFSKAGLTIGGILVPVQKVSFGMSSEKSRCNFNWEQGQVLKTMYTKDGEYRQYGVWTLIAWIDIFCQFGMTDNVLDSYGKLVYKS